MEVEALPLICDILVPDVKAWGLADSNALAWIRSL